MKPMFLMAAAGVLMAAPSAHAQQASRAPEPSDPTVAVPQAVYQSAMSDYSRALPDSTTAPDKTWRQMNDAVGAGPAHAGHGAAQAPSSPPAHGAAAAPAKPAEPAMPTAGHGAHRHH